MLLETLLKNTSKDDPEVPLIEQAIKGMSELADNINQTIREREDLEQLISIAHKIINYPVCFTFLLFKMLSFH